MTVPMVTLRERSLFAALLVEPATPPPPTPTSTSHGNGRRPALTPRQHEVLTMLADGKQARRIADELQLSEMTVRNHIRSILCELGCTSQLSAVAEARRLGLV